MKTLFIDEFESPIGKIIVAASRQGVERVIIASAIDQKSGQLNGNVQRDSVACRDAIMQLKEYFAGTRKIFTVPLHFAGAPFCIAVWAALQTITYGATKSYSAVAAELGNPRACRAVGLACRSNPIPLFIPCHRVVGKQGQLTGYVGNHPEIKQFLLNREKK